MNETEQSKVVAQWRSDDFDTEPTEQQALAASMFRSDLVTYCASHPDDKIAELEYTLN